MLVIPFTVHRLHMVEIRQTFSVSDFVQRALTCEHTAIYYHAGLKIYGLFGSLSATNRQNYYKLF